MGSEAAMDAQRVWQTDFEMEELMGLQWDVRLEPWTESTKETRWDGISYTLCRRNTPGIQNSSRHSSRHRVLDNIPPS